MYHNFTIFQDFTLFYLNLGVTFFHMYSQKDGLFPGPESPSPELIFLAGDLARGSLAKCINAPPIGRVWGDTHSGVQAAPLRQHHGVAGILP